MKALKNKTNTVPPGGDYPYGDLKDNPGDNSGTPVNRELMGDIHRTIEKIMDEAGITANGLDDNESNGYQIYEAMKLAFRPYKVISGILRPTEFVVFENNSGKTVTWSSLSSNQFILGISGGIDTAKTVVFIEPLLGGVSAPVAELRPIVTSSYVGFNSLRAVAPSSEGNVYWDSLDLPSDGTFVEIRIYN